MKVDLAEKHDRLVKKLDSLQGKVNYLTGRVAEKMLATELRNKKHISLSDYFSYAEGAEIPSLDIDRVKTRFFIQADDQHPTPGKNLELDVIAESGRQSLIIEMKKTQDKIGPNTIQYFWDKVQCFKRLHPDRETFAAIFSAGGFTSKAQDFCDVHQIGTSTRLTVDIAHV